MVSKIRLCEFLQWSWGNHYSILTAGHLLERTDADKCPRWKCETLYCKVQNQQKRCRHTERFLNHEAKVSHVPESKDQKQNHFSNCEAYVLHDLANKTTVLLLANVLLHLFSLYLYYFPHGLYWDIIIYVKDQTSQREVKCDTVAAPTINECVSWLLNYSLFIQDPGPDSDCTT